MINEVLCDGSGSVMVVRDGGAEAFVRCTGCSECRPIVALETSMVDVTEPLPLRGDPRFYALLTEIAALHGRKSGDYSPGSDPLANFKGSAEFGVRPYLGILTRLRDKWGRLCTFAKGGEPMNESARDSHIDSAVYHLLAILLLEDEA